MSKKTKIIITVAVLIILVIVTINYFFFGSLRIASNIKGVEAKIDEKKILLPFSGLKRIKDYTLTVTDERFIPQTQKIKMKPGTNTYQIVVKTVRDEFIESLPIDKGSYLIEYNKKNDLFYIIISEGPADETKKNALNFLKEKNIDPSQEEIYWDVVAGID